MASQPSRPRRNNSPASSKPQPLRATQAFSLLRNPSPTRGNPIRRPSPSSSPVHSNENGLKPRRSSPETRGSPEHRRSPTSPSSAISKGKVERPKPLKASSTSSFSQLRRTSSLDAISGTYMSGQWPRAADATSYGPTVCHKSTQTPAWDDTEPFEEPGHRHKRSNSWGSADHLREKLRQQLQRIKQGSKSTATYGRQSPLHGDHSAIHHKTTQSVAIPIPKITRPAEWAPRRSLEGLNSEVQKLVLKPGEEASEKFAEPLDGRKAPVIEILASGSPFATVDTHTQTPADNDSGSQDSGNSSSRSHSASPSYPIMAGSSDSRPSSRCSSGEGAPLIEGIAADSTTGADHGNGDVDESPVDPPAPTKYVSSPKPNNTYLFAREPPDGAEKVTIHVEDIADGDKQHHFIGPDKTKVKIIFSQNGSAFSALPSFPKMAIPSVAALLQPIPTVETSQ